LVAFLAGSIGLSVAAGMLSWWLVEKPALRLGRKLGEWSPWKRESVNVACCAAESPAPAHQ
jgi:peptidoglycan/LPS O-acetylase OafA/YrhL